MGAHEVTNAQYQRFLAETGYAGGRDAMEHYLRHHRDWNRLAPTQPSYPIVCVSWKNAQRFCGWLSRKESAAYRLPTEAEWEYACRAGSRAQYYWGDVMRNQCAWHKANCGGRTHPVGQTLPNAFGFYDMSGNAGEWCQSLYVNYPYRADDGREDVQAAGDRAWRGGEWLLAQVSLLRSAARRKADPTFTGSIGFRVVCSPKP